MKCPRCDQRVAYMIDGSRLRMFDTPLKSVTIAVIRDDGLIGDTHVGRAITEHLCPDRERTFKELQDEFWEYARDQASRFVCPESRCRAEVGKSCTHLNNPLQLNTWPHKTRVSIALTPAELDEARKKRYL